MRPREFYLLRSLEGHHLVLQESIKAAVRRMLDVYDSQDTIFEVVTFKSYPSSNAL